MGALIVGILFLAFTVISCMPSLLAWGPDVIEFLKGGLPVLAAFIGIIAIFIGFADIKDKNEAKKEEAESKASESK